MKILYAIQGTGNGHISRAKDIIPILRWKGELDILVSGGDRKTILPFRTNYRLHGLGFVFGKKGGIDFWRTFKDINFRRAFQEIKSIPVEKYDLILNDFEPISAWAAKLKNVQVISLSHQAAVLDSFSPKPSNINWFEKAILDFYAPAKHKYGFHFQSYNHHIFTPVIREEIRTQTISIKNHFTVYLPAYSDEKIIKVLSTFPDIRWQVFSKHSKKTYLINNILISPVKNDEFIKSLVSCRGVLCGAGFETPAEALYLKKKLLVVPMKVQFEQKCNAKALKEMGVMVIKRFNLKNVDKIKKWLNLKNEVSVHYPNITEDIIDYIFAKHIYSGEIIHTENTEVELS